MRRVFMAHKVIRIVCFANTRVTAETGAYWNHGQENQLEDNLAALTPGLTAAEIAELDTRTAPAPQYPGWFSERTVDPIHKNALL